MDKNHYALIMAGGVGSRFWSVSRSSYPKQFLDILGRGKALIQEIYEWLLQILSRKNIYILTNIHYKDIIQEKLNLQINGQAIRTPAKRNASSGDLIRFPRTFTHDLFSVIYLAISHSIMTKPGIQLFHPETGCDYVKTSDKRLGGDSKKG